jgi:hypothetical protein
MIIRIIIRIRMGIISNIILGLFLSIAKLWVLNENIDN